MGVVYEAHDPVLDRPVAIKLVRADRLRSEKGRERLVREAQTIAQMSHPNIVAVYEVGHHDDRDSAPDSASPHATASSAGVFIAMELVVGKSLRKWLASTKRNAAEILAVLEQAGEGLAAAHEVGIVHRDFKPDNVMRSQDGRVRVLDFGLARVGEAASSDASDASHPPLVDDAQLTQTGVAMGTPAYMAPEQFVSTKVDAQCDQFAFCVVAIEALSGKRPFTGNTMEVLARQTHRGEIDPTAFRGVPAGLASVLRRGLAADPARRWPDMGALLHALRSRRRRRRRMLAAAVVLCVGTGIVLADARAPRWPREAELRAGLWDEPARARLHATFTAIGTRSAESTWDTVQSDLDRRVDAWIAKSATACGECLQRHGVAIGTAIATLAAT
ncbi:MAG TPA: serine/threonine-protein kinase, partial [Nannocystaceae bacterium]|nr:serine/threonine-protein kinase [Nannocystaceae bacterium]